MPDKRAESQLTVSERAIRRVTEAGRLFVRSVAVVNGAEDLGSSDTLTGATKQYPRPGMLTR